MNAKQNPTTKPSNINNLKYFFAIDECVRVYVCVLQRKKKGEYNLAYPIHVVLQVSYYSFVNALCLFLNLSRSLSLYVMCMCVCVCVPVRGSYWINTHNFTPHDKPSRPIEIYVCRSGDFPANQ